MARPSKKLQSATKYVSRLLSEYGDNLSERETIAILSFLALAKAMQSN